jgi:two-component system nitrogen regulation response regulator NtrX
MPPLDTTKQTSNKEKIVVEDDSQHNFNYARERFERGYLLHHLDKHGWNISHTAADIGMERSQLHRKIKHFSLTQTEKEQ